MGIITQLPTQYLQASWARLFACFASICVDYLGNDGEAIIRQSTILYANKIATEEKQTVNRKLDMLDFAQLLSKCHLANNFRYVDLDISTEKVVREVYTCPNCVVWEEMIPVSLRQAYCEEFYASLAFSFLGAKQQSNLSKILCRPEEDLCQFSFYYRKANHMSSSEDEKRDKFCLVGQEGAKVVKKFMKLLIESFQETLYQLEDTGVVIFRKSLDKFIEHEIKVNQDIIVRRRWTSDDDPIIAKSFVIVPDNRSSWLWNLDLRSPARDAADISLEAYNKRNIINV